MRDRQGKGSRQEKRQSEKRSGDDGEGNDRINWNRKSDKHHTQTANGKTRKEKRRTVGTRKKSEKAQGKTKMQEMDNPACREVVYSIVVVLAFMSSVCLLVSFLTLFC